MNRAWLAFRLLLVLLVLLARQSWAQPAVAWPRHPTTGRVEFTGVIPWPTPTPSLPQQLALAQHWYLTKLAVHKSKLFGRGKTSEVTSAGLTAETHMDSVFYDPDNTGVVDSVYDRVIWSLWYTVRLTPTPLGLAYHLSEFEYAETVWDTSSSAPLAEMLAHKPGIQAVFHRRLRNALAGW